MCFQLNKFFLLLKRDNDLLKRLLYFTLKAGFFFVVFVLNIPSKNGAISPLQDAASRIHARKSSLAVALVFLALPFKGHPFVFCWDSCALKTRYLGSKIRKHFS